MHLPVEAGVGKRVHKANVKKLIRRHSVHSQEELVFEKNGAANDGSILDNHTEDNKKQNHEDKIPMSDLAQPASTGQNTLLPSLQSALFPPPVANNGHSNLNNPIRNYMLLPETLMGNSQIGEDYVLSIMCRSPDKERRVVGPSGKGLFKRCCTHIGIAYYVKLCKRLNEEPV